ncbi:hypothetical protein IEO21_09187 [Rhodonia placenta]|uniref:Uncharacterized protein n=1 Tax=Rhodonia placenta TaxID=104341 RepID=A0A8H7TY42_9APHY|nr:hypothetical protein IEO21_09187 [Postia placenta]
MVIETSKRVTVTCIHTSAERTNLGRGKWWNIVLSDHTIATGILWTLSVLVDVCDPILCHALLDPWLPTEHQTFRQWRGTAHGCQWIGGLSVIARNSGAWLRQHRRVYLVAE